MLTVILGTDWIANRERIMQMIAEDVRNQAGNRILLVPESISHDTERRLCAAGGDTASRFAEVLSFPRLCRRVADYVGRGLPECMDNGGRIVAMASSARMLHSRLKAYASVETRPEFLAGLVEAVDEFKRCCITPEDIVTAARKTEGAFAQKLEELSLLYEAYDSHCARGKRDPRDQMTWLLEQLEDCSFAEDHVFYIDGFPDFTRQHMNILSHLICSSAQVVVSLNCDQIGSTHVAFEKAGNTASDLYAAAKRNGIPVQLVQVPARNDLLEPVRGKLFQGHLAPAEVPGLHLFSANSIYNECVAVAQNVISLVENGARYRDIGIVCGNAQSYMSTINMVFHRCNIPVYLSGNEDILESSVISTVLYALDAALSDFDQRSMLHYMKSVLSPLQQDEADALENYVYLWSVYGAKWEKPWINHPYGLNEQWTENSERKLEQLNQSRDKLIQPLVRLRARFRNANSLRGQVSALYDFLCEIKLAHRLDHLSKKFESEGAHRTAQVLSQLWEILISALEQLYDVLGDTVWDSETFTRLLRLLLSQYKVGTIPAVLDSVTVGPVDFMRSQQVKHLFVVGALEGSLPGYGGASGVLSDIERDALRSLGVPLTGGSLEGLQAEFAEIYGVFCAATESISVSYPGGQASFIYRRLRELKQEEAIDYSLGAALTNPSEAAAYLAQTSDASTAERLGLSEQYGRYVEKRDYAIGKVSFENVEALYGKELMLSASQVDTQANCAFAYYLKYGIRAKERKPASVDPAEFGTYVHAVLEDTAKKVMELGGFHVVTMQQTLEIANSYSKAYFEEHFQALDSERLSYIFSRNGYELEMIVKELWNELNCSDFVPADFELGFGENEKMPAVHISGEKMQANLRGYVDRVDTWSHSDATYYRVVDYKTGRKDFDYCDIFNGLGLQMLLYLFALEKESGGLIGENLIPAGVQYFPARAPLVSSDGMLTDDEASELREHVWKRRGLLLKDEVVLSAMEPTDPPVRMNYRRKKDGSLIGDLADREQFFLLRDYVFNLLGKMVDKIAEGEVTPNPYTRGSSHDACAFCPYGNVCHADDVGGRRNYQMMSAQRFWDEVRKELNSDG